MGIDTYLTVVFWIGVLMLVIRGCWMCGEYPRVEVSSLGKDVFSLIIAGLFFAWICVLKFN
jgi:hypothetical protein